MEEVILRLEALAQIPDGRLELGPPVTDDEMSSWTVSPPEDIREFFRRIGGFTLGRYNFNLNHPGNHIEPVEDDYYPLRDNASNWVLFDGMGDSTTYYVDIDAETGTWGRVFSFWRDPYARLIAPNFHACLDNLVTGMTTTMESSPADLSKAFSDWFHNSEESLFRAPAADDYVSPVPVPEALASGDAELAEIASRLPGDAYLADLRTANYPTEVQFANVLDEASYTRFHNGGFLAATPFPTD